MFWISGILLVGSGGPYQYLFDDVAQGIYRFDATALAHSQTTSDWVPCGPHQVFTMFDYSYIRQIYLGPAQMPDRYIWEADEFRDFDLPPDGSAWRWPDRRSKYAFRFRIWNWRR
jgi:hypothetical protein